MLNKESKKSKCGTFDQTSAPLSQRVAYSKRQEHRAVLYWSFSSCLAMSVYHQTPSILLPSSECPQPGRPVCGLMDEQQHGAVRRSMAQGRAPLSHTLIPLPPPISQSALALNDRGLGPGRRGKSDLGSVAGGHSGHLEARCDS